ncbi:MAG TPA: glycogen debranching protein [Candidatus Pelethocola excrementipullorum]|nr:glycogen debranching protein [Candidatus Pelethocola excrementipullorum]
MKMDLSQMPFSRAYSYMALSELSENFKGMENVQGLYLRTVHGSAPKPLIARIIPTVDGKEVEYDSRLERVGLRLQAAGKEIGFCFDNSGTLLIRGMGEGVGISLDFLTKEGTYDYIYEIPHDGVIRYMANCYKNNCRYLVWAQKGDIVLEQKWEESSSLYSKLHITGEDGFVVVLREIETEWDGVCRTYNFETSRESTEQEFLAFYRKMPECPMEYKDTAYRAAYLNWSSLVKKNGFLTRDAMFMSKNWMCNVWSWDHCFNAIALSYHYPELAWDQFMIMFDHQDATGLLPDSINDVHIVWNYCKPPIHGWALDKMMKNMELSRGQMEEAYRCLEKWTCWWLNYRDYDGDGLCEYNHGNDSGWDNSTVFSILPPVESPDLQAYLIIQMEVLSNLAGKLRMETAEKDWAQRSSKMLEKMLKHNFRDHLPVAVRSGNHEIIENDSLLPYECIVLGRRLPKVIRKEMIKVLYGNKFYTDYGFATESPDSVFYRTDGYWRGPIWAPSTMILLDGLYQCGEKGLVREAADRFAAMVTEGGFAENFDALTGKGLRDRAYTWTSSAFLVMTHEYLNGD